MPSRSGLLFRLGLIPLSCSLVGCTVVARSGHRSLPVELRSSSDIRPVSVGMDSSTPPPREIGTSLPDAIWDVITRENVEAANKLRSTQPGERREGLAELATRSYLRDQPYLDLFIVMGRYDPDAVVRATAVRILNRTRSPDARAVFVEALGDANPRVLVEACLGLSNNPSPAAEDRLRELLADEAQPANVRIAAADALRHFPGIETRRALVAVLLDRDFAVAWQSRRSLFLGTGRDLRYDQAAWLESLAN
jgi:hypothetical protein